MLATRSFIAVQKIHLRTASEQPQERSENCYDAGRQCRGTEIEPLLISMENATFQVPAWRPALAMLRADGGRHAEAKVIFDKLVANGCAAFPDDNYWLTSVYIFYLMVRGVNLSTRWAGFFFLLEMVVLVAVSVIALVTNAAHLSLVGRLVVPDALSHAVDIRVA